MFLQYALGEAGQIYYIEQSRRGRTTLRCPYCGGPVLAKKGEHMAHHFAHAEATCRQTLRSEEVISLPAYDNFNVNLTGKQLEALTKLHRHGIATQWWREELEHIGVLKYNAYRDRWSSGYELSHKGKIPFGELSLMLFNQYQEPLILAKHDELEVLARRNEQHPDFAMFLSDLQIYRAQMRRILSASLYFLRIKNTTTPHLYKIGVTIAGLENRILQIRGDLKPYLGDVEIEVLGTWPHRGNVELYFKHRYAKLQFQIGPLTEYFRFEEIKPVLLDLRRMKPKELSPLEQDILDGKPSLFEQEIAIREAKLRRQKAIREGMAWAAQHGKHMGRPQVNETDEEFLAKPKIIAVRRAIEDGLSLRKAAEQAGVSVNTVRKVRALLGYKE